MQSHADALAFAPDDSSQLRRRQAAKRSVQDRCDAALFDGCEIGREAYPAYRHRDPTVGSIAVATLWLALFAFAAVHSLVFGN